jgi:pimeloyl-ACP methyl ester carboxylesterase
MVSITRMLGLALLIYLALAGVIYAKQEQLMFHFAPVADDHVYRFNTPHDDIFIRTDDARLHGVLFRTSAPRRGILVYYKGNAGNVGGSEPVAEQFLRLGFDVLSMDYRGFGKSRGPLSEENLLNDAERWFDWATVTYAGQDIRVLGYSMGTTFASHVSAVRDVANTILLAPMRSVVDVGQRRYPYLPVRYLSEYPLNSEEKLARAKGHIVIYHGTRDSIVAYASGKALSHVLGDDDSFVTVDGGTHYDLLARAEVQRDIAARWGVRTASVNPGRSLMIEGAGLSAGTARPR